MDKLACVDAHNLHIAMERETQLCIHHRQWRQAAHALSQRRRSLFPVKGGHLSRGPYVTEGQQQQNVNESKRANTPWPCFGWEGEHDGRPRVGCPPCGAPGAVQDWTPVWWEAGPPHRPGSGILDVSLQYGHCYARLTAANGWTDMSGFAPEMTKVRALQPTYGSGVCGCACVRDIFWLSGFRVYYAFFLRGPVC